MRFTKAMFLPGVLLVALTALFWGCGDDDESNPITWGDESDPTYQAVSAQFDAMVDSTVALISDGFTSMATLTEDGEVDPVLYGPGDPGAETDSLTLVYSNGWHVLHLMWHNGTGYLGVVDDSVQFVQGGEPVPQGGDAEEMHYRHYWSWNAPDTTVTHLNLNGQSCFDFAGLDSNIAVINGQHEFAVQARVASEDSTVTYRFAVEGAVTDLTVARMQGGWLQDCPSAGEVQATVTMTYQKDDEAPVETAWQFSATIEAGTITTTVSSQGYTWTYTRETCTPYTE